MSHSVHFPVYQRTNESHCGDRASSSFRAARFWVEHLQGQTTGSEEKSKGQRDGKWKGRGRTGKEEQERKKGRLEVGWGWGKRRCVWDPIRSALHLLLSLPTTSFLFMAQGWLCSQAFVKGKLGNRSALHHAPGASQGLHCPLSGCCSYFSYPFFVPPVHIPCPPPFLLANTLVFHHLEWTDLLPAKETRAFLASRENKLRRSDIWVLGVALLQRLPLFFDLSW